MMRSMRANAKWVMGILVAAFVGWMIYGVGMGITNKGQPTTTNAIAKVNGEKIDYQTYLQALENEQQQERDQGANYDASLTADKQRKDRVFEQLVEQLILEQEFKRRGIHVSNQEIINAARTSPPQEVLNAPQFQTDGKFDLAKYQRFISSSADPTFLMALEARYRDELPRLKLLAQLTAGIYVSDAELWQEYKDQRDSVVAKIMAYAPEVAIPDSEAKVTESDVSQYYNAHKDDFKEPATAYMSFIAVSRRPNASDSAAALKQADSVYTALMHGADFAKLAKAVSADSVSAAKGGDLGEAKKGQFTPKFEEAALALKPGQISKPVLTPFGYHIIKLISKSGDTYHASHILIPITAAGDHLRAVEAKADTLDLFAAEQDNGAELDSVAHRLKVPVAQAPALPEGNQLQLGRFVVGDASVWAFGPNAEVGGTSPVIETDWAYYVFRLDSLHAAGIPPLAKIHEQVYQKVQNDKKHQLGLELGRKIAQELAAGATLEQEAQRHKMQVQTVGPFTAANPPQGLRSVPAVIGAAFGLKLGTVGGPIPSKVAVYFVEPIRRVMADSALFAKQVDTLRSEAIRNARQDQVQLAIRSLREQANVQDLREELEKAQRAASQAAQQGPSAPTPNANGF